MKRHARHHPTISSAGTKRARLTKLVPSVPNERAGARLVAALQQAEGGALTGAEVSMRFGLTAAILRRCRMEHRIVYWRIAKHGYFYPRWQFTETGALLPGIPEILQLFRSQDQWRIVRYFLGPRQQLEGRRPLDLLRAGQADRALVHARRHADEDTW